MSSINTREQQLAQLREDAASKLKAERELVAVAVSSSILPSGTRHFHSRPGQFPGWHAAIARCLFDVAELRAYGLVASILRFAVENGALAAEFQDDTPSVVERLLNDSLDLATRNTCCNCGAPRDDQPLSRERLSCASCVLVDLSFTNDVQAAAAAAWVPLTRR